jgi:hypothetical protein
MQALIRETAMKLLQEIGHLTDLYQKRDPQFVRRTLDWLRTAEEEMGKLRHPSASTIAAQRGQILSTEDGYRPPQIESRNRRKLTRATAMQVLGDVERDLRAAVERCDEFLTEMREKMSQLLAVAAAEGALPLPPTEPRSTWLTKVWKSLQRGNGAGMFGYLSARLQRADRIYLLDELLTNMTASETPRRRTAGKKKPARRSSGKRSPAEKSG